MDIADPCSFGKDVYVYIYNLLTFVIRNCDFKPF